MYRKHLFFLPVSILFFLLLTRSQNQQSSDYKILFGSYQKAESIYNAATSMSTSDESRESELNGKALKEFKALFPKLPKQNPVYDSLRFFTSFKIGELEHYFENFKAALDGYNKSIEIQAKSQLSDSLLFKPFLYAGTIYYNQNKYDTASIFFHRAENVQALFNNRLQESERLYNVLGVLHYERGDYKQAGNYFQKSIELLPISHPYYKELYVNYKINLAQIYFKQEDYERANKIYQNLLTKKTNTNEILHNIGSINLFIGAPEKALSYFRKVHYSTNRIIRLENNIGQAYLGLKQFDSAKLYFEKALASNSRFGVNTDHIAHGITLESLGDLEMEFQRPGKALLFYQQAILLFYPAFTDTSLKSNPDKFSGVFSYIHLFNTLVAKAQALHMLYMQTQGLNWAEAELDAYRSAFKLIDYVERTYDSDEARIFLDKIKYMVHSKPIDIAFELYTKTKNKNYLEELYVFDQQNKASILSLKHDITRQASEKDSVLISKEHDLKSEITRLSIRAARVNDSLEVLQLNKKIRDYEIELGKLHDRLSQSTFIAGKIPPVNSIQNNLLDNSTALVSFHLSDSSLTTLVITKQNIEGYQQLLFPGFHQVVQSYISSIQDSEKETADTTKSKKLYEFLFSKIDLHEMDRLIIIPDDELNFLSFESLRDEHDNFLVRRFSVQYQYSTSLLKKDETDFSGHETLAFAPFTQRGYRDSSLNLDQLPNSFQEIDQLKGNKFFDTTATKEKFLSELSKYRVLHLATHAVASNKRNELSFVAFTPGNKKNAQDFLLYEEEIYNLPLHSAELIILSACKTGSGDLVKGEGIMSLSRAFTYAGCFNMLTTLWNANDFSTAYLTNRFHFYLDKKYSIDKALQQAKLDYLDDKKINPRLKHPFFWSHLVFIGNYHPARRHNFLWMILLTVGATIAMVGILVIRGRRRL